MVKPFEKILVRGNINSPYHINIFEDFKSNLINDNKHRYRGK